MRGMPRATSSLLVAGLLAACTDDASEHTSPVGPPAGVPSASISMHDPDPGINPGNTYYVAEVHQQGSTTVSWQSIPAGAAMLAMNGLDGIWNALTAPGPLTTDGFIHGPGQVYPRADRNQLIRNGDSHVGVTRSPFVRDELQAALVDPSLFNLPRQ